MDRLIYTAMTGANAAANRQAVLSNNLANVSTNGFRAQLATYRAVPLRGEGATTRVFALEASAGHSTKPGPAMRTDRALDAMALGDAWFSVQGLDGNEAYTRNGHFEVNAEGVLTTGNGLQVLSSDGSAITVPAGADVSISPDDTARVPPGMREGSNVNAIEAMVGMIQTARQFEAQMRLMQTAESNDRSAGQLLGLQG